MQEAVSLNILVTGTAGFIGYHVAAALLAEGHRVVGVDNFHPYYPVVLKRRRHALLEMHANYRGVEMDLVDHEGLLSLVHEEKIGVVCHLAAQAGVRHSLTHPFDYQTANLQAFLSVLEACRHGHVPRLVYASSSSVYGGNTKLPFSEDDPVEHPISLYAATKRANELMAHTYTHLYGLQTIGLRFFTVYGPWGRPDMAMWIFAEKLSHGLSIPVFNHGKMKRDFTYIDDIVAGVKASLFTEGLDPYEVINLGNHQCENLMDMIGEIARSLNVEPKMELLPMQPGDVPATYADITRAERKLGFRPTTTMKTGVANFMKWFKAHPDLTEDIYRQIRA